MKLCPHEPVKIWQSTIFGPHKIIYSTVLEIYSIIKSLLRRAVVGTSMWRIWILIKMLLAILMIMQSVFVYFSWEVRLIHLKLYTVLISMAAWCCQGKWWGSVQIGIWPTLSLQVIKNLKLSIQLAWFWKRYSVNILHLAVDTI